MLRILYQTLRTGTVTEKMLPEADKEIEIVGNALKEEVHKRFHHSLTIREIDAGSCNGCELEIHAMNNPYYDCERFGVHFTASPRFADVLFVTGPVSRNMEIALKRTVDAAPDPKIVVAVGDCAACGGAFGTSYASLGAVENVVPVDVKVPGCPPSPAALIRALLEAVGRS
ncbi:MAG: hydrogenase [Nitrospirae bacterium RBG_16_64_22]|nr:MAG: hydrogenase [Nitrospirae bacterium RBG_16_64_22]